MTRRGWTLYEMLVSLTVVGVVLALASHAAAGQLRFLHGITEVARLREQLAQTADIAAVSVWAASPSSGDILAAQDSALGLRATVASAVVCASDSARIVIPRPSDTGNTLAAFIEPPRRGDRIHAFLEDSPGGAWLTVHAAGAPTSGGDCSLFPEASGALTLELQEAVVIPAGAALRFTRPMRISLYRASDRLWYVGARDWNDAAQQLNTIQPVAGPLSPYSADASLTGLRFEYRDRNGSITGTLDATEIASISITARGDSRKPIRVSGLTRGSPSTYPSPAAYRDSISVTVALRNAQ